jgi:hypothetical protein
MGWVAAIGGAPSHGGGLATAMRTLNNCFSHALSLLGLPQLESQDSPGPNGRHVLNEGPGLTAPRTIP